MKHNIMKKWMLILAVALCLNTVAFAEGDEPVAPAAPEQVEQVKEEKKAEAPKPVEEEKKVEAEKPAEVKVEAEKPAEPAPEAAAPAEEASAPVEAPAEPAAPAEVEAPAEPEAEIPEQTEAPAEVTEAGSEETADEAAPAPAEATEADSEETADEAAPAPAEDDMVEIDDYETPLGVTPDPAPFGANVKLQLRNQGEIYYGDTVTIEADITDATGAYDIRWEVDRHDENGWSVISGQNGSSYGFVITEDNAAYDYRVVLTSQA